MKFVRSYCRCSLKRVLAAGLLWILLYYAANLVPWVACDRNFLNCSPWTFAIFSYTLLFMGACLVVLGILYQRRPHTMARSNFLVLYRQKRDSQTMERWKRLLPVDVKTRFKNYLTDAKSQPPSSLSTQAQLRVVEMWTEDLFYRQLQYALIADRATRLERWMWFIVAINHHVTRHPVTHDIVVYRGSKMSQHQLNLIKQDRNYRICMFGPASRNKAKAAAFGGVLVGFVVPKGCRNACDTHHLVNYLGEKGAVFLPPYTALHCKEKNRDSIVFHVLDNTQTPKALPTIFI